MSAAPSWTRAHLVHPVNVGIKGIEIYFPSKTDLEAHDGISAGKYTIGLGQKQMSFCDDREGSCTLSIKSMILCSCTDCELDIYSFSLTVVSSLIKKYGIQPASIGRLEVGTETLLDKSKSVKSVLMQLFEESGNADVEGIDTINACYGGTNAFFNAVQWIESSNWDGRDAIVVAGDIAIYDKGPARPTGGAGAVALWIGPNAPIVCESGRRGSYMQHAYDFYKPNFKAEYPVVDGHLSIDCYFKALDACYSTYTARAAAVNKRVADGQSAYVNAGSIKGKQHQGMASPPSPPGEEDVLAVVEERKPQVSTLQEFDLMCFHSPNCKLVAKSFARLNFLDFKHGQEHDALEELREKFDPHTIADPTKDKVVESAFMKSSASLFSAKVDSSLLLARSCGNMYTASLFGGLASLIALRDPKDLLDKRIGMFSYGSGLASSMFSLRVVGDTQNMREALDLEPRLASRIRCTPTEFENALALREDAYGNSDRTPIGDRKALVPGTWYLKNVDQLYRRSYEVAT
ncbi:hydroxymethylglutaryl-CoA synthase [Aureobasidium subglaciale]|nr:hydroxymethylglutaryl-CoA synthase [Aureobasidium subglaciale]